MWRKCKEHLKVIHHSFHCLALFPALFPPYLFNSGVVFFIRFFFCYYGYFSMIIMIRKVPLMFSTHLQTGTAPLHQRKDMHLLTFIHLPVHLPPSPELPENFQLADLPTAAFQAWSCRGYKFNWDNNSCTSLASTANHLSLSDRCLPQSCEPIPTSELLRCTKPLLHFLVCVTINLVKLSTVRKSGSCFRVLSKLALALVMTGWTWWMIVIYFNMFLFWKIDLKLWIWSLEAGFSPDAVFPPIGLHGKWVATQWDPETDNHTQYSQQIPQSGR